jgi:hypothetical protein
VFQHNPQSGPKVYIELPSPLEMEMFAVLRRPLHGLGSVASACSRDGGRDARIPVGTSKRAIPSALRTRLARSAAITLPHCMWDSSVSSLTQTGHVDACPCGLCLVTCTSMSNPQSLCVRAFVKHISSCVNNGRRRGFDAPYSGPSLMLQVTATRA